MIFHMIYNVILFGFLVFIVICAYGVIERQQTKINSSYNDIDDMNKCPNMARFMTNIQTTFLTSYFALLASAVTGCFIIVVLIGLSLSDTTRPMAQYGFIYLILTMLCVFIAVYKILGCFVTRMCGGKSCDSKYFDLTY
jgi:hypothetical protein